MADVDAMLDLPARAGGRPRSVARPGPFSLGFARRMRWGVIDQAVSSLTNFTLVLMVARVSEPAAFGAFSVTFVVYLLALWGSRSLVTEPFAVRHSDADERQQRAVAGAVVGAALVSGVLLGLAMAGTAAVLGGRATGVALAMAAVLPALLLQDSLRYVLLARGRPATAAAADAVWLGVLVLAAGTLSATGRASATTLCLAFGAGAAASAAVAMAQCAVIPAVDGAWRWVRDQADLGVPLLVELLVVNGAPQVALFGSAAVGGATVVGSVRAALLLFGPLTMVFAGLVLAGLPECVRLRERSPSHFRRLVVRLGVVMPSVGVLWTLGLLLVPDGVGALVLGANWPHARPLVPAIGVLIATSGCTFAALVGLRAAGAVLRSLRARAWSVPVTWAGALAGAASAGAAGAAAGLALGSFVDAALAWATLQRVLSEDGKTRTTEPP